MSNLVIPAPKQITIPIQGSDQEFPVRRVYCIGRNYAAHTIDCLLYTSDAADD